MSVLGLIPWSTALEISSGKLHLYCQSIWPGSQEHFWKRKNDPSYFPEPGHYASSLTKYIEDPAELFSHKGVRENLENVRRFADNYLSPVYMAQAALLMAIKNLCPVENANSREEVREILDNFKFTDPVKVHPGVGMETHIGNQLTLVLWRDVHSKEPGFIRKLALESGVTVKRHAVNDVPMFLHITEEKHKDYLIHEIARLSKELLDESKRCLRLAKSMNQVHEEIVKLVDEKVRKLDKMPFEKFGVGYSVPYEVQKFFEPIVKTNFPAAAMVLSSWLSNAEADTLVLVNRLNFALSIKDKPSNPE